MNLACLHGRTEIVQLLINSSKDFGIDLNARDSLGRTVSHFAYKDGKNEIIKLLIKFSKDFSIDWNARDIHGLTPLHVACKLGRISAVQLVAKNWKEHRINIKAKCNKGRTPLDLAKDNIHNSQFSNNYYANHIIIEILKIEFSKMDAQNDYIINLQ